MNKKKFIFRVIVYCIGAFFTALGVAFAINAALGVSPVTSLPYVLSLVTNIDVGIWFIFIFMVILILQILILRKDFKWITMTQILISTLFGYFVIFAQFIIGDFVIPSYPGRLLTLLIGNFCIAFGVTLYVSVRLVPMPVESLAKALSEKLKKPFYKMKLCIDCTIVLTALIFLLYPLGGFTAFVKAP